MIMQTGTGPMTVAVSNSLDNSGGGRGSPSYVRVS
nr:MULTISPECIES: hypothetical protein [unclassified Burkholderia]